MKVPLLTWPQKLHEKTSQSTKLWGMAGLSFLFLMAISGFSFWGYWIGQSDVRVIDDAGYQRLLIQRMASSVESIYHGSLHGRLSTTVSRVKKDARRFDTVLNGLIEGDSERNYPPAPTPRIKNRLLEVKEEWEPFRSRLDAFIAHHQSDRASPEYSPREVEQYVHARSRELAQKMDAAVEAWSDYSSSRIRWMLWGEVVLIIVGLLLLGGATYWLGRMVDETETELRQFRQLAENEVAVFWMTPPDKEKMIYVSPAYEEIWGRSTESLYENPTSFLEAVHPDDRPRVKKELPEQKTGEYDIEYRVTQPDGEVRWVHDRAFPVKNENDDVVRVTGIASDITERKEAEKALWESEQRFRQMAENIEENFWMFNDDFSELIYTNEMYEKIFDQDLDRIHENPRAFLKLVHEDDRDRVEEAMRELSEEHEPVDIEWRIEPEDGDEVRWVHTLGTPVRDDSGDVHRLTGVNRDITDLKRTQRKNERLSRALNEATDAVFITDPDGTIRYVNQGFEQMTGYSQDEAIGQTPRILSSGEHDTEFYDELWDTISSGEDFRDVVINETKEGDLVYCDETIRSVTDESGDIDHYVASMKDITDLKQAEKRVRQALEEKTTLIQEVHHRVKNNLQVILGLLGLQGRTLENPAAREALKNNKRRIHSMALVHQKLYQDDDLSDVCLPEYVEELVDHIIESHETKKNQVSLELDVEEIQLSMDTLIPCGLITNELVTNSLQHAFPGGESGTIRVSFTADQEQCRLRISDDGVGIEDANGLFEDSSLGGKLVKRLSENQLKGDLKVTSRNGLTVEVTFSAD